MMRQLFLFLSTQKGMRKWMETSPVAQKLTRRFIAGETLEDELAVCARLASSKTSSTLDHLGENVTTLNEAASSRDAYLTALDEIAKNAAPPVLALMGLQFGYLLGGSILVETVFNWPGSGNLLNLAIFRRDIPVLQATILVLATFFVLLNLLVDIAQAAIDPRIRR